MRHGVWRCTTFTALCDNTEHWLVVGVSEGGGREAELVLLCSPLSTPPSILHSGADNVVHVLRLFQHFTLYGPTTFYGLVIVIIVHQCREFHVI